MADQNQNKGRSDNEVPSKGGQEQKGRPGETTQGSKTGGTQRETDTETQTEETRGAGQKTGGNQGGQSGSGQSSNR